MPLASCYGQATPQIVKYADRPLLAIQIRIVGFFFIATTLVLVKYSGEQGISAPELMFWRSAFVVPLIGGWLVLTRRLERLRTRRIWIHARRAAVGMVGMTCHFLSVMLLPLPEQVSISFSAPLFAVILSAIFLKDKVGPWRWSSVLIGLAGVLVITQPGNSPIDPVGAAFAIGSALSVAVISFLVRDLAKTEDALAVVFYFSLFGALIMAAFLPFFMVPHSAFEWLLLLGLGTVGAIGQWLITLSLRYGAVATVVAMDYTAFIWATLFSWLIWDQLPVDATWLGAPAIILAGLIITWREHRLSRQLSRPAVSSAGPDA